MMIGNNLKSQSSGVDGSGPGAFFKGSALDGTAGDDSLSPVGTMRWYGNKMYRRYKAAHATLGARTDDWAQGLHVLTQTVKFSEFTDGGGTSGTFALTETIPVGAKVIGTTLVNVTGFTGDTSAVITVGDGTDVDRYNTSTPSVFTTAAAIDGGAISGTAIHATAATVTLTVTSATDFTLVTAGQLTVRIYYLN